MPSSELSRILFWNWAYLVSRLESLLLGMPSGCSKAWYKVGTRLVQEPDFYSLYTKHIKLLNKLSFFIQKQITVYTLTFWVYTTKFLKILNCYTTIYTHHPQSLLRQLNKGFILMNPVRIPDYLYSSKHLAYIFFIINLDSHNQKGF